MNTNWNLYRLFYYVAHYGSTSAAAQKLFVSQPSVSRGIKTLEEDLNCVLFERSIRGMELTDAGKLLLGHIQELVKQIEAFEEKWVDEQSEYKFTADVAVIDTTMQFFLMPRLEAFRKIHPNVSVNIHQCIDISEVENLVISEKADFAIMCEPSGKDGLDSIPVKKVSDVLVCAEKYKDMVDSPTLSVHELKNYPVIMHSQNQVQRVLLDEFLRKNGVEIRPKYEFTRVSSILRQMKEEFALAFILENTIRGELEKESLAEIKLEPQIPCRYYYMIKPKRISGGAACSLAEFLIESAEL